MAIEVCFIGHNAVNFLKFSSFKHILFHFIWKGIRQSIESIVDFAQHAHSQD